MKAYIYSLILGFIVFNTYSQTPIINRYGVEKYGRIEGAYYKDINGFHNQYIGTWVYNNGNTTFKVVFKPKDSFHVTTDVRNYYADFLIGEFQYIDNGIEKVNTFSNINQTYSNIFDYNIVSVTRIYKSTYPLCPECEEDERRLLLFFNEPSRRNIWGGISNNFVIRRFVENGQEKLKVQFVYTGNGLESLNTMDGPPANINSFSVLYGEYILIKQP
ncbi:DUF6705 family protein [Flavobacterium sp. UBA4197]|uniref:DUF6705 family protein n=1 Tax=Flavobacterium sp. UBA4197 TaxID=1946546 RepID=UPI00257C6DA4|nr:DUF6705 family protein [Flavobacterium sp. UBA4197]